MLNRNTWPMALSVMFVGSVAVIVHGEDGPVPAKVPDVPAEASGQSSTEESRKPMKPKELSGYVRNGLECLINRQYDDGGVGLPNLRNDHQSSERRE